MYVALPLFIFAYLCMGLDLPGPIPKKSRSSARTQIDARGQRVAARSGTRVGTTVLQQKRVSYENAEPKVFR